MIEYFQLSVLPIGKHIYSFHLVPAAGLNTKNITHKTQPSSMLPLCDILGVQACRRRQVEAVGQPGSMMRAYRMTECRCEAP